jgi:hypothetical protein
LTRPASTMSRRALLASRLFRRRSAPRDAPRCRKRVRSREETWATSSGADYTATMASRSDDNGRRPLPSVLGDVLAESRKFALERSRTPLDRHSYALAVGRRIADRTELGELRRGELTVYVASPAWAQELSLLAPQMLERLRERGVAVQRLRFRLQNKEREKNPTRTAKVRQVSRKPLPPELDARLAKVDDEELRRAIADAAGLAFGRAERVAQSRARRAAAAAPPAREAGATTSKPPGARYPRGAGARSDPKGSASPPSGAASRDTRAKRRD